MMSTERDSETMKDMPLHLKAFEDIERDGTEVSWRCCARRTSIASGMLCGMPRGGTEITPSSSCWGLAARRCSCAWRISWLRSSMQSSGSKSRRLCKPSPRGRRDCMDRRALYQNYKRLQEGAVVRAKRPLLVYEPDFWYKA